MLPFLSTKVAVGGEPCLLGDSLPETQLPSLNCSALTCPVGLRCVEVLKLYERTGSANLVVVVRKDNNGEFASRSLD